MKEVTRFAELRSTAGNSTSLCSALETFVDKLAVQDHADVAILPAEDGFSPLGAVRDFLARDLMVSYEEHIRPWADRIQTDADRVKLAAIKTRNPHGHLRGLILAPGSNSASYRRFSGSKSPHPNRSYYYNVAHEAIRYACKEWGARKLAISHLSGNGEFHGDMATCQAEALAHYCDSEPSATPESFIFCGCCITRDHLRGIERLNQEAGLTAHRPIKVQIETDTDVTLLHLDWNLGINQHAVG